MNSEQRARELLADCLSEFGCDGAGYAVRHEQEGRENLLYPAALRAIARALEQPASAAGVEGMVRVAQLSVGRQSVDACKLSNAEMTDEQARETLGIGLHDLYAAPKPEDAS